MWRLCWLGDRSRLVLRSPSPGDAQLPVVPVLRSTKLRSRTDERRMRSARRSQATSRSVPRLRVSQARTWTVVPLGNSEGRYSAMCIGTRMQPWLAG